MKLITLLGLLTFLSGCADLLQRRTFIEEMDEQDDDVFVAGRDFESVPGDSANPYRSRREIMERTPSDGLSKKQSDHFHSLKKELWSKERALSPQDYREYSEIKPDLGTISEQIYFLSLSREAQIEYLEMRQIGMGVKTPYRNHVQRQNNREPASSSSRWVNPKWAPDRQELYVGMRKEEVMDSWGRPVRIDVAGNPEKENERWSFRENGQVRQVYFEGGRVQGWYQD